MQDKQTAGPWDAWIGKAKYAMTGPAAAASFIACRALKIDGGHEMLFVEISSKSMECPGIALGDTIARAVANARLIAVAPELLEAMKKRVKNAEERAFEDWLARGRPSGDVESVQRQWEESSDLADMQAEWSSEIALIAKATGSTL